jgi:sortase A
VKRVFRGTTIGTLFISLVSISTPIPTHASVMPTLKNYGSISIPSIGISAPLHMGIGDTSLAQGFGLWPHTALPGQKGNTVIAGHRTSHTHPLLNIDKIAIGDVIYFYTPMGTAKYQVIREQIVQANDVWITRQTRTATATLFACTPPHSTAQRYVVTASLVKFTAKKRR